MPSDDWLVGGDRRAAAAERIYEAAIDMMARSGINELDLDELARRVHCSRSTIYRYVGGKTQIRDAVVARVATRITTSVRSQVESMVGAERVTTAILATVRAIRSEPLCRLMIASIRGGTREVAWLAQLPFLEESAAELAGLPRGNPAPAEWAVRVVLSLMYWPAESDEAERQLVAKFVAPAFTRRDHSPYSSPKLS
ncbi:TetR/AcrR family transcriptional regulator [Mycobacterium camsae]|uniref:TetR/AcrR family transcriptional regulator n=1 Tax=Mycobacterium gordonae TaxID=1778 RepID=UPI001981B7DA|nr:TetR/AcrR family transcriptional regulator [Mycobacterium gordonae]